MSESLGSAVPLSTTEPRLTTTQRVPPLRHPGRWIASAIVLVVVAQIVHGLATNRSSSGTGSSTGSCVPRSSTVCSSPSK